MTLLSMRLSSEAPIAHKTGPEARTAGVHVVRTTAVFLRRRDKRHDAYACAGPSCGSRGPRRPWLWRLRVPAVQKPAENGPRVYRSIRVEISRYAGSNLSSCLEPDDRQPGAREAGIRSRLRRHAQGR